MIIYRKTLPKYGELTIEDTKIGSDAVRLLKVDGAIESVMYLDEKKADLLFSDYLNGFNWVFSLKPDIRTALLIGGGGFAYPKQYFHAHPDLKMDVVEISEDMVQLAEQYFGLDHLLKQENHPNIFIEDGLEFLETQTELYDVIFNDAYIGRLFNKGLQSRSGMEAVKQHLTPGGIYVINLVTAPKGLFALRGNMLIRRLQKHFRYTFFMQASDEISEYETQNCLVFASDRELGM